MAIYRGPGGSGAATADTTNTSAIAIDAALAAQDSANAAAASAVSASTSATDADTSEANAATSATNAASFANTASSFAFSASTSATAATTKASEAATYATDATTKASEAATSATNAANSATLAASYTPSQTGNSGKFLTTNGTATSWGVVNESIIISFNFVGLAKTTGTPSRWYPERSVEVLEWYAMATEVPTTVPLVMSLKKNGTEVDTLTILADEHKSGLEVPVSLTLLPTDYLTVENTNTTTASNVTVFVTYKRI
jgi:hypothetical protein